jgi:predicted transcriptional regulator
MLTLHPEKGDNLYHDIRYHQAGSMRAPLTGLESDVMQVVWDKGPCPVEAVYQVVSKKRDLKETTIRTILRRLEQKGYVKHEADGRAYVYQAAEPARGLAARAVRQIIDNFCRGSMEDLVSGMLEARVLSKKEFESLEEFVRKHGKTSRKKA